MHEEASSRVRPALHIIEPQLAHTHTAILLHGRGSTGPEFAEELFATQLSDNSSLTTKLPGWRWVFPSSTELWSTTFQERMPAWFEAQSLTDLTLGQDLQIPGIMDSCEYIHGVIEDELNVLDGKTSNLLFGGISQGGAVAMWMLLCRGTESRVGAFFAASTWLPFAQNIKNVVISRDNEDPGEAGRAGQDAASIEYDTFIRQAMGDSAAEQCKNPVRSSVKVFLGHGLDDAYVDVELGRQARQVLSAAGFGVEWKEYSGAEEEGHWLQEPNEMDDIHQFMRNLSV
ncbi:hypothetical protein NQ176_g1013 [Zarea fungicola]|uniref:Uncharacterized protein n=1 Tax=Zarea fungicola TaxID=93591 RepID=A0ACC1NUK1_9HYPO|nr:hypothetical protein NQ176_g1013 [Lecanicillium fungicola]